MFYMNDSGPVASGMVFDERWVIVARLSQSSRNRFHASSEVTL